MERLGDLEPLVDALPNADAAQLRSCSRQGPWRLGGTWWDFWQAQKKDFAKKKWVFDH